MVSCMPEGDYERLHGVGTYMVLGEKDFNV